MKTNALDVLVEDYIDKQDFEGTANGYDALKVVCKNEEQRRTVEEAIKEYASHAFRSGFYTALSFMTGGVE